MSGTAILAAGLPRAVHVTRTTKAIPPKATKARVAPITVLVSDLAYRRGKERMGIKGKELKRRIERAWWEGTMGHKAGGELAIWMARKQNKNPETTSIRVLNGYAFLFALSVCTTILRVPDDLSQ